VRVTPAAAIFRQGFEVDRREPLAHPVVERDERHLAARIHDSESGIHVAQSRPCLCSSAGLTLPVTRSGLIVCHHAEATTIPFG
jgi:hypothetical protein